MTVITVDGVFAAERRVVEEKRVGVEVGNPVLIVVFESVEEYWAVVSEARLQ